MTVRIPGYVSLTRHLKGSIETSKYTLFIIIVWEFFHLYEEGNEPVKAAMEVAADSNPNLKGAIFFQPGK